MSGLLEAAQSAGPGSTVVPPEEIRFAVVLNGGVSLAVWMGGTMVELDRLAKARAGPDQPACTQPPDPVYEALLALTGCTARADVISGTSAGGINGAALALCQVNTGAELGLLRDIWVDQGRIESLLRQPFRGAPTSLLKGDEFFLPQLNNALSLLAKPSGWRAPALAPIDLSISTTVLGGNQLVTMDATGQALPQTVHAGMFHWARLPQTIPDDDPFHADRVERTAHRLALAARSTASFPVAFEPVFVPVNSPQHAEPNDDATLTEEQRLRPDMATVVQQWGNSGPTVNRSRYVVDGGLLANTPTRPALEAVESMPAGGPVRRVMLLVYPHAEPPRPDTAADQAAPPTVLQTVSGLLNALAGQGSRTFVDEIEAHNMFAASRRGTRSEILLTSPTPAELEQLAHELYGHYGRLRRWRTARDLARWATHRSPTGQALNSPPPRGWDYERVRRAAERAQSQWQEDGFPSPYVPAQVPSEGSPQPAAGWGWGVSGALGIAEAATDVLRRLVWVLPQGPDYDTVRTARQAVSAARTKLTGARKHTDGVWQEDPVLASLQPTERYWRLRLAFYQRLMLGPPSAVDSEALISGLLKQIAQNEASLNGAAKDRLAQVLATKKVLLAPAPRSAGDGVLNEVLKVVSALTTVSQVLEDYVGPPLPKGSPLPPVELQVLAVWRDVLFPSGVVVSDQDLLTRLLQVDVAATTLGDEVTTGATLPLELVQLSAQTANAFARYTHSGDDKLGGMSVSRFGGFLKRSWRVNDWTWGRIDAASTLCRIVLSPARMRRTAELSGYLADTAGSTPDERAAATLTSLVTAIFPDELPPDPRLQTLEQQAKAELVNVLNPAVSTAELGSALPALADLFAWALHLRIVPEELPVLAGAIRADGAEGANARSHGAIFIAEHELVLARLDSHAKKVPPSLSPQDRAAALEAFDRAGVGREPLQQEGTSDQMIRTATTAAAVAATIVDSEQSGFTAIRPVTRTLRGAMLLPFWVVTGLTGKGVLARSFSLLALAIGAVLLPLSLFGALPAGLSGPGAALGASAVLTAFAIGALRSGTMIHGLALLTPVVPLVVFAVNRPGGTEESDAMADSAQRGVSTLLVVVALAVALMVLGSLPATSGSVLAALDRLADRQNIRPVGNRTGWHRRFAQGWRRAYGLAASLLNLVLAVGVGAAVVALTLWITDDGWGTAVKLFNDAGWWSVAPAVTAVVIGAVVSYVLGRHLQVLTQQQTAAGKVWSFQPVTHPAGAAAGWAVVYGTVYLVIAAILILIWDEGLGKEWEWLRALPITAVMLGVLLVLVVPVWLSVRAMTKIANDEVQHALAVGTMPMLQTEQQTPAVPEMTTQQAAAWDMVERGVGYRCFVRPPDTTSNPELRKRRGTRLHARIQDERTRLERERKQVDESERARLEAERKRMKADRDTRAKEQAEHDRTV